MKGGIQVTAPTVKVSLDSILSHFLSLYKDAACSRDVEGLTPLLRAASFGSFKALKTMLEYCPECVEVYDFKGRTVVHYARFTDYKDLQELLMIPEIDALKNVKDCEGNTPAHLAAKDRDLLLLKVLHDFLADFSLKNDLHISVDELINEPQKTEFKDRVQVKKYIKEITMVEKMMDNELYMAALQGDIKIFDKFKYDLGGGLTGNSVDSYYLAQTPDGSNIIHIALRPGNVDKVKFVEEALNRFPALKLQIDSNGDTPLHLAAKWESPASTEVLERVQEYDSKIRDQGGHGNSVLPWKVKNFRGHMAIHEALYTNNEYAAKFLVNNDPEGAFYVSDAGETPLHVYARCASYGALSQLNFLEDLVTKNISAVSKRDNEGLTPLLRSAKSGRVRVALAILKQCPQVAQLHDPNGRTFLHLLRLDLEFSVSSSSYVFKLMSDGIFKIPEVDALRTVQDYDGNSPLHYAIKTGNSTTAKVLAHQCFETTGYELVLVNNENENIFDVIASFDTPTEIVKLLQKLFPGIATSEFLSSYGIRKAEIKELAASLSVTAALLATITFAAAFQVPGGFNGDNGSPVLLKKAAFQVFLLCDVFAMCGSMVVLFSLLWVMATRDTPDSFKLLDLALYLLQLSFYTTLVAFMTGVYVVTASRTPWLAIFVCVLCTIVILVTRQSSVRLLIKSARITNNILLNLKTKSLKEIIRTGSMMLRYGDGD